MVRTVPTAENKEKLPLRCLPLFDSGCCRLEQRGAHISFRFFPTDPLKKHSLDQIPCARIPLRALRSLRREELLERKDNRGAYARRVRVTRGSKLVAIGEVPLRESSRASRYVTPPRRNPADHNDSSGRGKLIERAGEWIDAGALSAARGDAKNVDARRSCRGRSREEGRRFLRKKERGSACT